MLLSSCVFRGMLIGGPCCSHRYPVMRQGITLTGLGTPTFGCALEAVQEIYELFDRVFEEGQLELDSCVMVEEGTHAPGTLHVSNRYLTPKRDAMGMVGIPLGQGVDPQGCLAPILQEGRFVHGEDNEVRYYKSFINENGEKRQVKYHAHDSRLSIP